MNADGTPKWRGASPHGPYWRRARSSATRTRARGRCSRAPRWSAGRPRGCTRSSPWPRARRSRSSSGLTPIRDSDIRSEHVTKVADKADWWSSTGALSARRGPPRGHHVRLSEAGAAVVAEHQPGRRGREDAAAGHGLAGRADGRRAGTAGARWHAELPAEAQPGEGGEVLARRASPKAKLANEKPKGETVPYEQLLQAWKEGRVK